MASLERLTTITASIITLGCAKNSVDSEHIKASLIDNGIIIAESPENADVVIINTCGFIQAAKEESISTILATADLEHHPKIIVTGCLAQRYYDELLKELPEIDVILGISDEFTIAQMMREDSLQSKKPGSPERDFSLYPDRSLDSLPYAYLQIAEGCDNCCSYCAIPQIRGSYVSKPKEQVLEEARWLDSQGIREINIIAQDTGLYGRDVYKTGMLPELLESMHGFENICWIRLLYLQPFNINERLIEAFQKNRLLVPYLDIPIQHASEHILRKMNRSGTAEEFLSLVNILRKAIPEIVLRTTVIVGFPGETDGDFQELCDFAEKACFDYMGIFIYSDEDGTAASLLPSKISEQIKLERYHDLNALQDSLSEERNLNRIGTVNPVLIERALDAQSGLNEGRAIWQAPEVDGFCYLQSSAIPLQPGAIVKARIEEFDGCDFFGSVVYGSS